jgi:transcriptional regulator with XRE-family HTH domain
MKTTAPMKKAGSARSASSPLPNAVTIALGLSLKRHRELVNKTQIELAYDAEVERSRISKIECGYVNPSLLTLATLCYSLGITLPALFDGITVTMPPVSEGGTPRRTNQAVLEKQAAPKSKKRTRIP